MKKVLSLFLSVLMLTSVVAAVDLSAYAATASGSCGDDVTYTLDGNTLTISGTGNMYNYNSETLISWYDYKSSIENIVINSGVTSVGDLAFRNCTSLTSVTIPDGVTSIGEGAFRGCTALTSITIPDSVTSLGMVAFAGTSLTSITIPDSVTSLGGYAFWNCTKLTSVTIPDSVITMGNGIFYQCSNLKNVIIGDGLKSINDDSFRECASLTSISIGKSVASIGGYVFYNCTSLKSITIPDNVTKLGKGVFYNCTNLKDITLGNGITRIYGDMFTNCVSLKSLTIPNSVTELGEGAFTGCSGLKDIIIPVSVIKIGPDAFLSCANLTNIYYLGSKSQWNEIKIDQDNSKSNNNLNNVTFHYDSCSVHKTHSWDVITKSSKDGNGKLKCSYCKNTKTLYKIKSMSLSKTSYTYDGKAKKPTVTVKDSKGNKISSKYYTVSYISQSTGKKVSSMKNPGKYYVKVTFKTRYSGSLKKTVTIKPKKTSIKSIKASKKGFTVKWSKVSTQNTGYQIQYSTSKSFKSPKTVTIKKTGTTSKKVTKLKAKKRYYVRVRTYKTVKINGKSTKIYSGWSSTKGVTTKK